MKDNVFKILSIIFLLLGLGVSARIIGQNDSVNLDQNPIIADPHNPALGGDATLAIPPSDPKALSFVKYEAANSRNLQFPENQEINTGLLLNLQAGCYHFFTSCNGSPAICNLSPDGSGGGGSIFATTRKRGLDKCLLSSQ